MCLCKCGKFAKQALFSVQVMALGSTNREVNMTAGEVLFLERQLPNLYICPPLVDRVAIVAEVAWFASSTQDFWNTTRAT